VLGGVDRASAVLMSGLDYERVGGCWRPAPWHHAIVPGRGSPRTSTNGWPVSASPIGEFLAYPAKLADMLTHAVVLPRLFVRLSRKP